MGKSRKKKGTKTQLEYVEKEFKWHVKPVKCLNERQKEFIKSIKEKEVTITSGLSGSGKTFLALWQALRFLEKGSYDSIVLVKSVQTIPQEECGFLPGNIDEKMSPFMLSYNGNLDKLIGEECRKYLMASGKIKIQPLAYVRGINIDNSIVIVDEVQNLSIDTFKTIITRIGTNSKYILMGDVEQIDLKYKSQSSLQKLMELFQDDELVGTVHFTKEDCVRNPIIPHLLDKIKTIE